MTSEPDFDTLQAFYAGGDAEQVRELADDIEWHVPGGSPIAGDYHGVEAVFGYFAKRRDLAKGTFHMDPVETLIGDEHVAVLTDGTAVVGGVTSRTPNDDPRR